MTKKSTHHNKYVSAESCAKLMAFQHIAILLADNERCIKKDFLIDELCHYPDLWYDRADAERIFSRARILKILKHIGWSEYEGQRHSLYYVDFQFDFSKIILIKKYLGHQTFILEFLQQNPLSRTTQIIDAMIKEPLYKDLNRKIQYNLLHALVKNGYLTKHQQPKNIYVYSAIAGKNISYAGLPAMPALNRTNKIVVVHKKSNEIVIDPSLLIATMFPAYEPAAVCGGVK